MRRSRLIALVVGALGLCGLLVVAPVWNVVSALLALAVIAVAAAPLLSRYKARTFDLLEPIVGGSVVLAIIFGLRPLAMLLTGDITYRSLDIRTEFPIVIVLGLTGTVAFTIIYEFVRTRPSHVVESANVVEPRLKPAIIYSYVAVLAVLSVALFAVHLARLGSDFADGLRLLLGGASPELINRWAGTTEYLSASPILSACAATLVGIATMWKLNRYQLALIAVLIAYPLLVFYVSGDRRYMIPSAGVPIVAWMLMSGWRPPRRVLLLAVPVAFLVLTAIPFVRWGAAQEGSGGFAAAFVQGIGNPVRAVDRFLLGPDTDMFSAMAIEVRVLREPEDFFYGRATVGDLVLAPIPHVLIPGKPLTARDELLTRAYGTPCAVTAGGVCDDFSIIGTGYQDFWVPGVVGLMAIIGAASAGLWSSWKRSVTDPRWVAVLSPWVIFVPIVFRAGFMPAAAWCLYFLVPCLVGVMISLRRPRSAG